MTGNEAIFHCARSAEILMFIRMLFLPVMFLKDLFGGRDWEKRRSFVEWLVACKISAAICESDVSELDNGKMAIGRIVGIDCV